MNHNPPPPITPPIVVGVDGSESALHAVRWAAGQARRRGTWLRLVHAYEIPVGYYPTGMVDPHVLQDALVAQGKAWLAQASEVVEETTPGLRVEALERHAAAVPMLIEESVAAAQVVLGTRGLGGFTGLLVGSTAVGVTAHAHSPVVVVRGTEHSGGSVGPVVVGVDGTPAGEAAIAFAFAEAAARGAGLVAVHAWTDLAVETLFMGGAAALDFAPLERQAEETLTERLIGWQEKYPDVAVTRKVVHERAVQALLREAQHAGLVVVGSRGRGGFRGLLLGSTSQQLLHHAPCPVAVVRSHP